ncbi:MAG: tetratricopeptide repeat protein [Chloroflexi bacterium]|nr:tetratricopeptide repeat protein [Chloroflexota bacterium]
MIRRLPRSLVLLVSGVTLLIVVGVSTTGGLALYEARQADQLRQQDDATRVLRAAVQASQSSTDALVATLQEYARQRPNEARVHSLLGAAYLQKARETADPSWYSRADGVLHTAIGLNPDDTDALTSLGELALARHRFAEAIDWGRRSLALNEYKARTLGVIGDGLVEIGRYDDAFETFQRMVDLRPDMSSYARVAYARELLGDVDGAIEAMQMAANAGAPYGENTAYTYVQLGHLAFNAGRFDDAERAYEAALRFSAGYKPAQAGIARVAAARGDSARAIALLRDVVDALPLPEYVIALADLYRATGQPAEADRQDDLVRAIGALYQANGVDLDLDLARFDVDRGRNLPDAISRVRTALAERPTIGAAGILAWGLYQAGQFDEASVASQQALRLGTRDARHHYQAGMIAQARGDYATAIQHLEQALAINPAFSPLDAPRARQELAALRQVTTGRAA